MSLAVELINGGQSKLGHVELIVKLGYGTNLLFRYKGGGGDELEELLLLFVVGL